jgi:ferredoxin
LKNNTPLSLNNSDALTTDPIRPDDDGRALLAAPTAQSLDIQALRKWFHLPQFNQRDGLDDYDGDYRGFDALGKLVTAHLRHRLQRLAAESSDDPCLSAAGAGPQAQPSAPRAGNPGRPPATPRLEAQANINAGNESRRPLSRMLAGIRSAVRSGAKEVCAVFCYPTLSTASVECLPERFPGTILVKSDRLPAPPGPGAWLGALAMGAGRVILLGGATEAAREDQLRLARSILTGLHLDPGSRLLMAEAGAPEEGIDWSSTPAPLAPGAWEPAENDRDLLWQAVAHLHSQVPDPPDATPLAPGAPFGAVALNTSCCTLCMACVGACPTNALQHGSPGPEIRFRERDCSQCGRCRQVCPEQAVTLIPRICYDPRRVGTARILHQDAPLRCSVCGAPFATAGMVAAVSRRLAAHWMYQDPEARLRLTMCRDCRIRSCFGSPQAPPQRRPAGRKK